MIFTCEIFFLFSCYIFIVTFTYICICEFVPNPSGRVYLLLTFLSFVYLHRERCQEQQEVKGVVKTEDRGEDSGEGVVKSSVNVCV